MDYEHGVGCTFAPFPRLPPELRGMIWEMALRERHGCLHVVTWAQKSMFQGRTDCASYGPFDVTAGHRQQSREPRTARMKPGTAARSPSALSLVCREARAAVLARNRDPLQLRPLLTTRNRADTRTLLVVAALAPADMLYIPDAPDLAAAFKALRGQPFAAGLERLAVTIAGRRTARDEICLLMGIGMAGDGFVDAVRALPRLREVYLVVGGLFSGLWRVRAPELPAAAAKSSASSGCLNCPFRGHCRRCQCSINHVSRSTALREHVRAQRDDGFGFSAWEPFAARWRWPLKPVSNLGSRPTTVSLPIYSPRSEDYCRRVRDQVREVAHGLGRRIDVKLVVDLDGELSPPLDPRMPSSSHPALYSRSDMNFRCLTPGTWWEAARRGYV